MMVIEGATGKVLKDILNTPGVHGAGLATKAGHGFTTNGGDSTVTMFDLKTFAVLKQIKIASGGLDGIMYDEPDDKIILTNHSRPIGTLTAIDPKTGDIVATVELEDTAPEGAAADGKGHIFVNNESKKETGKWAPPNAGGLWGGSAYWGHVIDHGGRAFPGENPGPPDRRRWFIVVKLQERAPRERPSPPAAR